MNTIELGEKSLHRLAEIIIDLKSRPEPLIEAPELCDRLNIKMSTLNKYCSEKRIPYIPGRPRKFRLSEVEKALYQ